MTEQQPGASGPDGSGAGGPSAGGPSAGGSASQVPHEEWPAWCRSCTERFAGRGMILYYVDEALGEVRLADGQPLVALEHDVVAATEALTIKYGDGVVPVRHVIAEPSEVAQQLSAAGDLELLTILDGTGRRTFLSLVQAGA